MMNKYLEINFSVDRLKVGIYYMCRRLFDKIESTETGIIFCFSQLLSGLLSTEIRDENEKKVFIKLVTHHIVE